MDVIEQEDREIKISEAKKIKGLYIENPHAQNSSKMDTMDTNKEMTKLKSEQELLNSGKMMMMSSIFI